MTEVHELYQLIAKDYDRDRSRSLMEAGYLRDLLSRLDRDARVLDLGCGCGEPIALFFIEHGCQLTGIDAAPAMISLCRERFPHATWLVRDMRTLGLDRRFDAILAWDSFFHLCADEQRRMFPIFRQHITPRGLLLFTSGPRAGVEIGDLYGHELFHASLDAEEYQRLLARHGFDVLLHRVEDRDCGRHTVWLAQHTPPPGRYRAD
jgi:trans-aconitate methyltransferase